MIQLPLKLCSKKILEFISPYQAFGIKNLGRYDRSYQQNSFQNYSPHNLNNSPHIPLKFYSKSFVTQYDKIAAVPNENKKKHLTILSAYYFRGTLRNIKRLLRRVIVVPALFTYIFYHFISHTACLSIFSIIGATV